jgi:hypothetical protein
MAAENKLFKTVSADLSLSLFSRLLSPFCCPRRRSHRRTRAALLLTAGPAPPRRALPRAAQRPCAWDARAPARRRRPKAAATAPSRR